MDKDVFDGQGRDFSDHDSAEGVGDAGVDTDEGKAGIERVVFVEFDFKVLMDLLGGAMWKGEGKYLRELLKAPLVVFARMVAGEVGGCDICDCFGVDAYYLCEN